MSKYPLVGQQVRLDLAGRELEAEHCVGDHWFNDDGTVRINRNKLRICTYKSSHVTTRTDHAPGGFTRKVDVRFEPYVDKEAFQDAVWYVTKMSEQDEYEQGPGGNGSYMASSRPIGKLKTFTLQHGDTELTFVDGPNYYLWLPADRITVVDG